MKKSLFITLLFALFLIVGCTEQQTPVSPKKEPTYITFEIEHKSGLNDLRQLQRNTAEIRASHDEMQEINEQLDYCIEKKTKNWRRIIDDELIIGYDEEIDKFRKAKMKISILNGEEIC